MAAKKRKHDTLEGPTLEDAIVEVLRTAAEDDSNVLVYLPDVARSLGAEPREFREAVWALIQTKRIAAHTHDLQSAIPRDDLDFMPGAKRGKPFHMAGLP